jgi:Ca2+-binding RTX toxin-like protein
MIIFGTGIYNNDFLAGTSDEDWIFGLGGDDILIGGLGPDFLSGDLGNDTAVYGDSAVGVIVSLETGRGLGGTAQGDILSSIENLWGSGHGDWLIGNADSNTIAGGGGTDALWGGGGDDFLGGGLGGDVLDGGAEGPGGDGVAYSDSMQGVIVNLQLGTGQGGTAQDDTLIDIENVFGSWHQDHLIGNADMNLLYGDDGIDMLEGHGGADRLDGGDGNDVLLGGNDGDTLYGGNGRDVLVGEAGGDHFGFYSMSESGLGTMADVIADFNRVEGDRIDLTAIDADPATPGDQAFIYRDTDGYLTGVAGQLRIVTDGIDTYVALSNDTDPDNDGAIKVAGLHIVTMDWFFL